VEGESPLERLFPLDEILFHPFAAVMSFISTQFSISGPLANSAWITQMDKMSGWF
jgi:hypothetical protein